MTPATLLATHAELYMASGDTRHAAAYRWVMEHLEVWPGHAVQVRSSRMLALRHGAERKACFRNCQLIALTDARFRYVEGYAEAVPGVHVEHAWLVDHTGRRVFDPTWCSFASSPPTDLAGVVIDSGWLWEWWESEQRQHPYRAPEGRMGSSLFLSFALAQVDGSIDNAARLC